MLVRLLLALLLLLPFRLFFAILRLALRLLLPRKVPPYAVLRLEGALPWQEPKQRRWAPKRPGHSIERIEALLEVAKGETELRGVVVTVDELRAPAARLDAVTEALERLRREGKEVVLYLRQATAGDFALARAADRIFLAPGGMLLLVGHAASLTSLRGGLDKLGIVPEFARVGRWKSAPERFTREDISPENRQVVEEILDHRFERLITQISARTGGDRAKAKRLIDEGPYTSRRARSVGLVDELVYPDEVGPVLLGAAPERAADQSAEAAESGEESGGANGSGQQEGAATTGSPDQRGSGGGRALPNEEERALQPIERLETSKRWRMRWPKVLLRPQIAVIPIDGLIKPGKSAKLPGFSAFAGDRTVAQNLEQARKDPRVQGVVVRIDSRGGAAPASELMWRAVLRCAREKPTVAYVESVAASGGYFAAAGAGRIVAAPGALVGSIGVFSGRFDARALLRRLGVHQEVVLRGAHAGLLEPAHALSDEERRSIEEEIESIYEDFVERVAEGRGLTREEVLEHAEGRVFVAAEAPKALVDELGDFRAALRWICKEIDRPLEQVEVRPEPKDGLSSDLGQFLNPQATFADGPLAPLGRSPLLLWGHGLAPGLIDGK